MQQSVFLTNMAEVESEIIFLRGINLGLGKEDEVSKIDEAFESLHKILKSFFKSDDSDYSAPEYNEKEMSDISLWSKEPDNKEAVKTEIARIKSDLLKYLSLFDTKKYLMTDMGNRFPLAKRFKDNIAKIKAIAE